MAAAAQYERVLPYLDSERGKKFPASGRPQDWEWARGPEYKLGYKLISFLLQPLQEDGPREYCLMKS